MTKVCQRCKARKNVQLFHTTHTWCRQCLRDYRGSAAVKHKQERIGTFQTWEHGTTNGYKKHACRCALCSAAMSAYAKSRYVPHPTVPVEPVGEVACWINAPREGFTAWMEKSHGERLRNSRFGRHLSKSYETYELGR